MSTKPVVDNKVTPAASVETKDTIDTAKATTVASVGETNPEKAQDAAGHPSDIQDEFRTDLVGLTNQDPEAPSEEKTLQAKGEGKELTNPAESPEKTSALTKAQIQERQAVIEGKLRTPNSQNRNYLD